MTTNRREGWSIVIPSPPGRRRRGLTSIVILVGLVVIAIVAAGLLKVAASRRSTVEAEERRVQAEWLAEAGLARACSALAGSQSYSGETWEVPAEDLGGRGRGSIRIEVGPVDGRADRRRVRAVADFPAGSPLAARQSRESTVAITTDPSNNPED